ncbi:hypothetical protein [Pluralibacter gergoviae]|uniref:Uncharacterized protein n=1 Tax=Pluralibacter gergoviae TaxID=61647 RepID=A0AAW8HN58_PLUGE|nr:hypothetical protein [Pluralibacter gergoviae]HBT3665992.1 hypothetical protein [Klebsiella pneumoniae]AVR01569.1 hypothetical protein A8H26_01970 [Pluralibacter gergoviae]EKV0931366.1 hypothetical protein [Pluralibacter gergoviae]ELD4271514.1 hypothetical protein [Pluralibacter gergoviae]ELD4277269.1 hypothetical protein [Pluralibacter gergoviae]
MNNLITFIITIAGAVVGGAIAGYYSFKATKEAHENQKRIADENEKNIITSLLQSIHDEIETIFDNYHENMGVRLESLEDNTPLLFYYPLVSDFFTIYNGNAFLLGRIKDNDLRKSIIKTYTLAKGLIDSYRMNNDLLQKYEHWEGIYAETQLQIHKDKAIAQYGSLIAYAKVLKSQHINLKENVKNTVRILIKNGVLNEVK